MEDKLEPAAATIAGPTSARRLGASALAALGVVYGDIGTSPLYAVRECFYGSHSVRPTQANVFGVLSLIVWALIIVISIKYLAYVLRADNRGEGGILALMALILPPDRKPGARRSLLVALGLLGAALLYGDGTITPAISVLSAIEGIEVATPVFSRFVVPITVAILVMLFAFQRRGTARVGAVFGPTMLVWFFVLAVLGIGGLTHRPGVLRALNPLHAARFFVLHGWHGFAVLGAVVLVVTGGEALYADMGHFGKRTIRVAWFSLVLPALLLNYFGQGALLLESPKSVNSPFYLLCPDWARYPLVVLATVATVIASQAIISGAFSLTRQAVQLGYSPRMRVIHTSAEQIGQVYLPGVNWLLMSVTILLVLGFRRSTNLAAAYGVAVTTTMVITTMLAYVVSREIWGWGRPAAGAVTTVFLVIDLALFGANLIKIEHGGWLPIAMAVVAYMLMSSWWKGRRIADDAMRRTRPPVRDFLDALERDPPRRVPGTAIFFSGEVDTTPLALSTHLKHNRVLHQRVVLLTIIVRNVPYVAPEGRVMVQELGQGLWRIVSHAGFMQTPRVLEVLGRCEAHGLVVDPWTASYFIGHRVVLPRPGGGMSQWRARLFALLNRNALRAPAFFHVPHRRAVEIGVELEM